MAHYKTAILFITWYYAIKAWCISFLSSCTHFIKHIRSYNENWLIFPGHALPQSRIVNPTQDNWVYNVSQKSLMSNHSICNAPCKLSWLSVKLVVLRSERSGQSNPIVREEYDMDPFFETLTLPPYTTSSYHGVFLHPNGFLLHILFNFI